MTAAKRRRSPWPAAFTAVCLLAAACGSALDEEELAASQGATRRTVAGAEAAADDHSIGPDGGGDEAIAGPGAGDGPAGRSTNGSTRTGSGGAGSGSAGRGGGSGGGGGGGSKPPIVLGSIGQESGIVGAAVASGPVAVRAWAADVNARGGLNGRPVRVVFGDDGGDPGRALALAKRMVEQDKVVAFFGLHTATTLGPLARYFESINMPAMGSIPAREMDESPMVFSPSTGSIKGHPRVTVEVIANLAPNVTRFAMLYCGEAASCEGHANEVERYAARKGKELVYKSAVTGAQPDFTAQVVAARNAGAEALIVETTVPAVRRIKQAAERQAWSPVFVSFSNLHETNTPEDLAGFIAWSTTAPLISPIMAPYLAAVRRHVPGGAIGVFGSDLWAAGKLLERIAPKLGDTVTTARIVQELQAVRNENLGGMIPPITFGRGVHVDVNLCGVALRFDGKAWSAPLGVDRFLCADVS